MRCYPNFTEGQRVRLVRDVERFPHFVAKAGLTGLVTRNSGTLFAVLLDVPLSGAEEWSNHINWDDETLIDAEQDLELIDSQPFVDRFDLRHTNPDGSSVYGCPHEIWNEVLITFPPGYWNAPTVPNHVDFTPFTFTTG